MGFVGSGGSRGGALGAEAPPFQSPLAFKCTDVANYIAIYNA